LKGPVDRVAREGRFQSAGDSPASGGREIGGVLYFLAIRFAGYFFAFAGGICGVAVNLGGCARELINLFVDLLASTAGGAPA
jgi:hypothetical protein